MKPTPAYILLLKTGLALFFISTVVVPAAFLPFIWEQVSLFAGLGFILLGSILGAVEMAAARRAAKEANASKVKTA